MTLAINAFSFNDVDYGATHNIIVRNHDYPLLPRPRTARRDKATANGAILQGVSYEPLIITLDCAHKYPTPSTPFTSLNLISAALAATVGDDLEYDFRMGWNPTKLYQARLYSEFNPERMLTHAVFTLVFICPDPIPTIYSP